MKGKYITLAVTGAIAAYKTVSLLRLLRSAGAEVQVIGTEHSLRFVGAETWRALSGRPPLFSLWEQSDPSKISHIMLAQEVDLVIVAPASANILAKATHGIADDLVSTVLLAATVPVLFAPGMNASMYEHPATQQNLAVLTKRPRMHLMTAPAGALACGTTGPGRMAEPEDIFEAARALLTPKRTPSFRWLIAAGATREYLDPIRFLTNGATGATGLAVADAAWRIGGTVSLVAGNMTIPRPRPYQIIPVTSASQMQTQVLQQAPGCDILCMTAAVADYAPIPAPRKIKKGDKERALSLHATPDILAESAALMRPDAFRVGFAAETEDLVPNARGKLERKRLDMIVANLVTPDLHPFGSRVNRVTIVTADQEEALPLMDKDALAALLVDRIQTAAEHKRSG